MSPREAAGFASVEDGNFEPLRIVEDGPVRTVVESYLKYDRSSICITYMIPAEGSSLQIGVRAYWNQPDRMLKLDIPAAFPVESYMGQTACGTQELATDGSECVAHKWVAAVSDDGKAAVSVINDCIYGSSFEDGKIRLTLLRSPAYSGHPFGDKPIIEDDRYTPRMDMGERNFSFRIDFGTFHEVLKGIDRRALEFNEKPMVLTAYPSGEGQKPGKLIEMEGEDVILQAFKKAEDGEGFIMRLYNGADVIRAVILRSRLLGFEEEVKVGAFEIATYRIKGGEIVKNNLVEKGE
jgi:alpha-mannosidase